MKSISQKDVFISYSTEDSKRALEICRLLEEQGFSCWIAPRDVPPGRHYAEAILEAIEEARATLLILSGFSNESILVRNEIERAVSKGKSIITVRITQIQPSKALELYISTAQWVDAWDPLLNQKIGEIVVALKLLCRSATEIAMGRLSPRIGIFAIGGGAIRAVNNLAYLEGASINMAAIHTFVPSLQASATSRRILLGPEVTKGLSCGGNIEVGRAAAEEVRDKLFESFKGYDLIFLVACFGGGTGTGAFPVIAQIARQADALIVGIVTTPFIFEGAKRMNASLRGVNDTKGSVDTMILIANELLLQRGIPIKKAYLNTDRLISAAILSVSHLITKPGLINIDFADIRIVFKSSGQRAQLGVGSACGRDASIKAARLALSYPSLERSSLETTKGLIATFTGGSSLSINRINEAVKLIHKEISETAIFLCGALVDEKLEKDCVEITLIVVGDSI